MTPPEPFEWHQRDACQVICTDCNTTMNAGVIDLHNC